MYRRTSERVVPEYVPIEEPERVSQYLVVLQNRNLVLSPKGFGTSSSL